MKENISQTLIELSKLLAETIKEVIKTASNSSVKVSPTLQKINFVALRPDLGAFVEFYGDYNGLFSMNFSKEAAFELYQKTMKFLGLPEEEISKDPLSDEVKNFIGEMVNQIIGNFRNKVEQKYGLSAFNNQPMAITIARTIVIYIETSLNNTNALKISLRTESGHSFHAELSLEQTEFIPFKESSSDEESVEALLEKFF